jgi:hypothetical protein
MEPWVMIAEIVLPDSAEWELEQHSSGQLAGTSESHDSVAFAPPTPPPWC